MSLMAFHRYIYFFVLAFCFEIPIIWLNMENFGEDIFCNVYLVISVILNVVLFVIFYDVLFIVFKSFEARILGVLRKEVVSVQDLQYIQVKTIRNSKKVPKIRIVLL